MREKGSQVSCDKKITVVTHLVTLYGVDGTEYDALVD